MSLLESILGAKSSGHQLSILKDPFKSSNITDVSLYWSVLLPGEKPWIRSRIQFVNGNTKGEQKIEASSMDELITKTNEFIKTLEKQ